MEQVLEIGQGWPLPGEPLVLAAPQPQVAAPQRAAGVLIVVLALIFVGLLVLLYMLTKDTLQKKDKLPVSQ